jgi:hypothetical protein
MVQQLARGGGLGVEAVPKQGFCRYSVPMPTPALRAMPSSDASTP